MSKYPLSAFQVTGLSLQQVFIRKKLMNYILLLMLLMTPLFLLCLPAMLSIQRQPGSQPGVGQMFIFTLVGLLMAIPGTYFIIAMLKETNSELPVRLKRGFTAANPHLRQIALCVLTVQLPLTLIQTPVQVAPYIPGINPLWFLVTVPVQLIIGIIGFYLWFYLLAAVAHSDPETGIRELLGRTLTAIKRGFVYPIIYVAVIILACLFLVMLFVIFVSVAIPMKGSMAATVVGIVFMLLTIPTTILIALGSWSFYVLLSANAYRNIMPPTAAATDCDSSRR